MASICHGNAEDHCCYRDGQPCEFLEENTVEGRRWVCGLRRELGSWEAVHADPRYEPIREWILDLNNRGYGSVLCGDWPPPGMTCGTCGSGDVQVKVG